MVSLALTLCMIKRLSAHEDLRYGDEAVCIDDYADADVRKGGRKHVAAMTFGRKKRCVGVINGAAAGDVFAGRQVLHAEGIEHGTDISIGRRGVGKIIVVHHILRFDAGDS